MKDKKKHGVFWFFKTLLTIALVAYTCVRCCIIVSDKNHVSALQSDSIQLTPAQTVALFGTHLQALLRTDSSQLTPRAITFDYAFPLSSIGYMSSGGGFSSSGIYSSLNISSDSVRNEVANYIGSSDGLVYVASSSQWGSGSITPVYPYFDDPAQLHIPFSISLSGISGIQQAISFQITNSSNLNNVPVYDTSIAKYLSGNDDIIVDSLPGASNAGLIRSARWLLPTYSYNGGTLDESQCISMGGFYVNTEYQEQPFDITGITIDCFGLASAPNTSGDLWLVVQCPVLWSYEPPVITTTRPPETIPAATYPVATMPPYVTDIPANIINQNLVTNNYQLNVVIGQLNLIYAQLKANGEISARLAAALEADNDPGLQFPVNTDIRQYMSNAVYGSGTDFSYSPEDLQTYSRAIPWLASMFGGQTWFVPFAFLGSIGLIMIVLSYVVFRR